MKPVYQLLIALLLREARVRAFRVDIQWSNYGPLKEGLRSFQEESEFYDPLTQKIPMTQSFEVNVDRTHNRVEKACKQIAHPSLKAKNSNDRITLKEWGYVKAVRIMQTPQVPKITQELPPFTHPYQRSARGIAFFGDGKCGGKPRFIIWPKQGMDMTYDTIRRYDVRLPNGEIDNFYYKWWQTFEFSDFDVRKDPTGELKGTYLSHYNRGLPTFLDRFTDKYIENMEGLFTAEKAKLKEDRDRIKPNANQEGILDSPMGSPYRQSFGSFREIYPTRADSVWRGIVGPDAEEKPYWDVPMINVQLDHWTGGGTPRENFFDSFVPYAILDTTKAAVFKTIEEEYARFYDLMVKLLGTPGKSWLKRLRWTKARQAKAFKRLEVFSDPEAPGHLDVVKGLESFPGQWKNLKKYEIYTTSPDPVDVKKAELKGDERYKEEWVLPPSWMEVPLWVPDPVPVPAADPSKPDPRKVYGNFQLRRNPNRIMYSSVSVEYRKNQPTIVTTTPVTSNPELAIQKEAVSLLEQLPVAGYLSESARKAPIVPDFLRPENEFGRQGNYYRGRVEGVDLTLPNYLRPGNVAPAQVQAIEPNLDLSLRINLPEGFGRRIPAAQEEKEEEKGMDLTVSNIQGGRQRYSPVPSPTRSRAGSREDLRAINPGNPYTYRNPALEEGFGNDITILNPSAIETRPRSGAGSRLAPPTMQRLEPVEYRPPRSLIESTSSLLRSANRGRKPLPNEIEVLQESVVGWQPPQPVDLRGELARLANSQLARTGKLQLPLGSITVTFQLNSDDAGSDDETQVPRTQRLKSSGTGKKLNCIPSNEEPFKEGKKRGGCFGLICC